MIVERESMMNMIELDRKDWFPDFIILRRKANETESSNAWQGYVREINSLMSKQVNESHQKIQTLINNGLT